MERLVVLLFALGACATSPGPSHPRGRAACSAYDSPQACAEASGCRYLAPGCAQGDEVALPEAAAGCYPDAPCSDDSCGAGTACTEVIVNPCLPDAAGNSCDACGEPRRVCIEK